MLAKDAPWWMGEWGNLSHDPNDRRPAYADNKPTGANASNYSGSQAQPTSAQESASPRPPAQAIDMSSYAPGRAQPTQTQSTGTPYATKASFSPPPSFYQQPSVTVQNPGYGVSPSGQPFGNPLNLGNYANNASAQRPQPFAMTATGLGGQQLDSLNQAMNQRAAALAQILDQGKLYKLAGATNQNIGPPQYNMNDIIGNANSMVSAGWQNPLGGIAGFGQPYQPPVPQPPTTMPAQQQPSAPGMAAIQDLFARNNIPAPQGFLDQLISLLSGNATQPQLTAPAPTPELPQPTSATAPSPQTMLRAKAQQMADAELARQLAAQPSLASLPERNFVTRQSLADYYARQLEDRQRPSLNQVAPEQRATLDTDAAQAMARANEAAMQEQRLGTFMRQAEDSRNRAALAAYNRAAGLPEGTFAPPSEWRRFLNDVPSVREFAVRLAGKPTDVDSYARAQRSVPA